MMRHLHLEHRFIKNFPEVLEPGVLYVSIEYGSAAHSCCCGCGEEVVTPFTPKGWKLTFDGETVSIWPSVGSWTLRCRSHYIIRNGRVIVDLPRKQAVVDDTCIEGRRDEERASKKMADACAGSGTSAVASEDGGSSLLGSLMNRLRQFWKRE